MEILRTISFYAEDKEMPFVLIGGHAVNSYGLSRQTGDIDLAVRFSHKAKWGILFERLKYIPSQDDDRFSRYRPEVLGGWPIDLMFLDDITFNKLQAESLEMQVGVATVRVVSARHLAILKMHALKYFQEDRFAKDFGDLVYLLRSGKTKINRQELAELCQRYASGELFEKLKENINEP